VVLVDQAKIAAPNKIAAQGTSTDFQDFGWTVLEK
jgi:hypothetical protein